MNITTVELRENELPKYDMSDSPTNCCPRFDPEDWDDRDLHFRDKLFLKAKTKSIMYVPLNIGSVFKKTLKAVEDSGAKDPNQFIVLSRDVSLWSAEHFFAVKKDIPGHEMVRLSGDYHTKVFEGPFKDIGKWCKELAKMGNFDEKKPADTFFFYTTCPKCAKTYGKNYVVGLVASAKDPSTANSEN